MKGATWDTVWNSDTVRRGDWAVSGPEDPNNVGGLQDLDALQTAILLAIHTNGRLPDSMVGTNGFTAADQFQYHGDTFGVEADEGQFISLLWTLERAPLNDLTGKQAVHYCAEALQILVKNHWCTGFDIDYTLDKPNGRIILVIIPLGLSETRIYYADLFPLQ